MSVSRQHFVIRKNKSLGELSMQVKMEGEKFWVNVKYEEDKNSVSLQVIFQVVLFIFMGSISSNHPQKIADNEVSQNAKISMPFSTCI